jgi:hypothetical protein
MDHPKECRDRAAQCIRLGNEAVDTGTQSAFFEVAQAWQRLAESLEEGQTSGAPSQDNPSPDNKSVEEPAKRRQQGQLSRAQRPNPRFEGGQGHRDCRI